ncbi:hypothetical protein JTB14_015582 [Gonioctena quinquepunctata]|nr:hypothetical protein JTB14_015582 [Gonioctena quinquepunctata]
MLNISFSGANCSKRRNLKKIAVPSQKLPLQKYEAEQSTSKIEVGRRERIGKRNALKENIPEMCYCETEEPEQSTQENEFLETEEPEQAQDIEIAQQLQQVPPTTSRDTGVQVNTPKIYTLCDIFATDMALNSFTVVQ